jgi:hypothetical protein
MSDNLRTMPAPPPNDAVPDARSLALELRRVVSRGAWASALDPAELPGLLALACVAGPAQENGESPLVQLIRVLKRVLEPIKREEPGRALELVLGLADTTGGYDLGPRLERTMKFLGDFPPDYQPESFHRRRVPRMLAFLADELVEYDRKYRMRDTHDRMAAKMPASPALAVMWLDRFQYYFRMTTDLSGIENDLTVTCSRVAIARRPKANSSDVDVRPCGSSRASICTWTSSWTSEAACGSSATRSKRSSWPTPLGTYDSTRLLPKRICLGSAWRPLSNRFRPSICSPASSTRTTPDDRSLPGGGPGSKPASATIRGRVRTANCTS